MKAGNAGVTLSASNVTVQGNDIGLLADGKTIAGNRGDGVRINASSHGDLIGQSNPVSSISYYNADSREHAAGLGLAGHSQFRHERRCTSSPGRRAPTGCCTRGPSPAPAARVTRSTTRTPRPRASTVPTISAANSVRLVGSYKNGDGTVHGFSSRARPPISRRAATTGRSIIPTRSTPTSTARWVTLRSATPTVRREMRRIGTGHAFLYDVAAEHVPAGHRLSGFDDHHGLRHLVQRRYELHDLRRL